MVVEGEEVLEMREVMWLKPLVVEGEVEVRIGLYEEGEGEIGYEVYRVERKAGGEEEEEVYGRGRVRVGKREEGAEARVEVEKIRERCERRIEVQRCYEEFAKRGVKWGCRWGWRARRRSTAGIRACWTRRCKRAWDWCWERRERRRRVG